MKQNYLKWKPILVRILKQEFARSRQPMPCHDYQHHLRVWSRAKEVAKNYQVDKEVLLAACLLHDISAQWAEFEWWDSHPNDARMAERILKKIRFPKEKISKVIAIIRFHGSAAKYKNQRVSIEAKIVCDCDKMESLGPLGVTRIIMALSIRGKTLPEIIEEYHCQKKIDRKYQAISLPELKKQAKTDYLYAKKFFQQLAKRLKN